MFYVYIIRCLDNSLYTGYTTDIKNRLEKHFSKNPLAAKYTKSHPPKSVEALWTCEMKSDAMRLEYYIKKLSKSEKENLILHNDPPKSMAEKFLDKSIHRIEKENIQ